jgi:hypothetical protein
MRILSFHCSPTRDVPGGQTSASSFRPDTSHIASVASGAVTARSKGHETRRVSLSIAEVEKTERPVSGSAASTVSAPESQLDMEQSGMSSAHTQLEDRGGMYVPAVLPEPGEHTMRSVELRSHDVRACERASVRLCLVVVKKRKMCWCLE